MDLEHVVKMLRIQLILLWTLVLGIAGYFGLKLYISRSTDLHYSRSGNELKLSSASDGPFVVYAITTSHTQSDKKWALLPEPVVIVDSGGSSIDLSALLWHNLQGDICDAPAGPNLEPLYVRPEAATGR